MKKYAFFAFKGEIMCFTHVMLNALSMSAKGYDVKIIMEGESTRLVREFIESGNPLFQKIRDAGLLDCICKACSAKMGVLAYNETTGIPLCDEMMGHPAMASYTGRGYRIITL